MEPQQQSYDTFARWLLTRQRADLAPSPEPSPSPLYTFFLNLYTDMLENPEAYDIPHEPFVTFLAPKKMTPTESAQHEALKAARMRVRKAVFAYPQFLYSLGQAGSPLEDSPGDITLTREAFEKLTTEAAKKAKLRHFPTALQRTGLAFSSGDPVVVSNSQLPVMPAALAAFSQACARVKDLDFYLFRRCDLAVFAGKTGPEFADALHLVPQPFQAEVAETDQRLSQMHFKRQIFVDGGDMTYRLRYSRKGDEVVYWVRILESFQPDLHHLLRWKLDSDLTPRLFRRLDETDPGLTDRVFTGLKTCLHCYGEYCVGRVRIEWRGVVKESCIEDAWNHIGHSHTDYVKLWKVLETLNGLISTAG